MKRVSVTILALVFLGVGIVIAQENCVCAGCGWKCGTGHASNCPYKPKAKDDLRVVQKVDPKDLKGADPKPAKLEKATPPPLENPKKEPPIIDKIDNKIDNIHKKIEKKFETPSGPNGAGAVRG